MNKRSVSLFLSTALLATAAGLAPLETQAAGEDIVILYTNDVHCAVDENIGYGGVALYKDQMEAQTPYVTLVDAGDAIQGAPIGTLSDGEYLIEIMNEVGYDFAVPGNHEFDYGMPRFLELAKELEGGYYSCNFTDLRTGKPVLSPYKMETYGDVQVAYLGVSTPESISKSTPVYFQDGAGNYIYGFQEDDDGTALYGTVQAAVDDARAAGADYVIAVGHLGENGVTPYWNSSALAAATNGIDAIIDGHSHEVVPAKTVHNKDGEEVLISQTGTKLENIGKMTIKADGTIQSELVAQVPADGTTRSYQVMKNDSLSRIAKRELGSYDRWREIYDANRDRISNPNLIFSGTWLTIPSGAFITEDGRAVDYKTEQFIGEIKAQYEESLSAVLGTSSVELTTLDMETGERAIRSKETNMGDFCADAFRVVLGADIGLMNGGGIRADLKPGNLTYHDILAVYPYGNMSCVVEATGQQIKDALEMASRNYPEESGGFLHVSGLTYRINQAVPSTVEVDDKGNFVRVTGDYRVTDIMAGGEPLDMAKTYRVASHNYMLKSGGSGMSMFAGTNVLVDDVMTDVDLLAVYINDYLGGTIGGEYADPAGQGRIRVE